MGLTVRFYENERYDINEDREVVMLMATTGSGSYHAEVPVDKQLGERRREFKTKVIELMQEGWGPQEVELET